MVGLCAACRHMRIIRSDRAELQQKIDEISCVPPMEE